MKNIPDIKSQYNKNKQGSNKKLAKSKSKQLVESLKQAHKLARDGLIARILYDGDEFYMMKKEKWIEGVQNQGRVNMPQELRNFQAKHQELLQLMGGLQYEIKGRDEFQSDEDHDKHVEIMTRNEKIFADLDQLTFPFAEAMNKTKEHRKNLAEEYKKLFDKYPILKVMLEGQLQK